MIAAGELKCEPATNSKDEASGLQCVSIGPERPNLAEGSSCSNIEKEGKILGYSCFIPTDSQPDAGVPPPPPPPAPDGSATVRRAQCFGDAVSRLASQVVQNAEAQEKADADINALVTGAMAFADKIAPAFPNPVFMMAAAIAALANPEGTAAPASSPPSAPSASQGSPPPTRDKGNPLNLSPAAIASL
ncbi:MAG: hypothetical protein ABH871_07435 [Pseudomonadota bacterium]